MMNDLKYYNFYNYVMNRIFLLYKLKKKKKHINYM